MRSKNTIKQMEMRLIQDNAEASINVREFWLGFEAALSWIQNEADFEEELRDYESRIEAVKEGYEKDPETGEYVSVVELHPETFSTFGEYEFAIYIGDDWRERLDARGYDWRTHIKKLET